MFLFFCFFFVCGIELKDSLVRNSIEHNESVVNCDESHRKMISSSGLTIHVNQLSHIGSFLWTTETQQIGIECAYD